MQSGQQHPVAAHLLADELALFDLFLGSHLAPLAGPLRESIAVDLHPQAIDQVAAEVGTCGGKSKAHQREPDRGPAGTPQAQRQGGGHQHQRAAVEQAVGGGQVALVAVLVLPVGEPAYGRCHPAGTADPEEDVGTTAQLPAGRAVGQVEHGRRRPGPDWDVGEGRVEGMFEPDTVQELLGRIRLRPTRDHQLVHPLV